MDALEARIARAWQGRVSGCQLGKPVELLSLLDGHEALAGYLGGAPVRDYIAHRPHRRVEAAWCKGAFDRSEADDDINYSVLALILLERFGRELTTADVARAWLKLLPAGQTFTAERAAYTTLLARLSFHSSAVTPFGGSPISFAKPQASCHQSVSRETIPAALRASFPLASEWQSYRPRAANFISVR